MKLNIKVVTKGQTQKGSMGSVCPWVLDVPPEQSGR